MIRTRGSSWRAAGRAGLLAAALWTVAGAELDAQVRPRRPVPARPAQQPASQKAGPTQAEVLERGVWFVRHGGRFHAAADPTKPAILLVHGLHQSAHSWTKPSASPIGDRWYFDYATKPERIRVESSYPNAGIFKVGRSERLDVDPLNWFDFLVGQGYTVATWSQPGETFRAAYPSADSAFRELLAATASASPGAPPPVALIGHSRGGLIIRQLLKDHGSAGRVRWVITLHSPHHGSSLSNAPGRACTDLLALFTGAAHAVEKQLLREGGFVDEFRGMCSGLNGFIESESRELAPNSSLIRGLAEGETAVPGVKYYTFGGTRPTYIRYYVWPLATTSSVPQFRVKGLSAKQYFIWEADPVEIPVLSPLFDRAGGAAAEVTPGQGDGLVTDKSARLPFALHTTTDLNHAEVLWDRGLQRKVVSILKGITAPAADLRLPGPPK